jgi:hypothetical protein
MTEQVDHPIAEWPTMITPIPDQFASAALESPALSRPAAADLAADPASVAAPGAAPGQLPVPLGSAAAATAVVETVTCPECGTIASIAMRRRESSDFCRTCDYPLFWLPSRVVLDSGDDVSDGSLRRLPGTVGKATVASLACPHCDEPNAVSAQLCVRCGLSMHPVAPPPAPEIVYMPPRLPEPVVIPQKTHIPWWVWVLVFIVLAGSIALLTFLWLNELN